MKIRTIKEKRLSVSKSQNKIRLSLIEILGKKCVSCGFSDIRALQIDHINGNGLTDFKNGNYVRYRYYVKNPEIAKHNLQILCANCNWIKKYEKSEHPRKEVS